ncbi:hypothetical protein WJX73_003479 [Symbiochloris irregularis]|uniref:F-box domain-containing protein n=1 Tax=Symbiochloris irregularis TaxID=706552 RepID=A0AAW1PUD8_9CHLO
MAFLQLRPWVDEALRSNVVAPGSIARVVGTSAAGVNAQGGLQCSLALSDGVFTVNGLLDPLLNALVHDGTLQTGTYLRLSDAVCRAQPGGQKMIMIPSVGIVATSPTAHAALGTMHPAQQAAVQPGVFFGAPQSNQAAAPFQAPAIASVQKRQPDWNRLPPELLTRCLSHLKASDLRQAELCCQTWHQILSNPQDPKLWGDLTIKLDTLLPSLSTEDQDGASISQLFLPMCRWLRDRAKGITSLHFTTSSEDWQSDWFDQYDCGTTCLAEAGFAMVLAALNGHPVDVHVKFECDMELTWLKLASIAGSIAAAGTAKALKSLALSSTPGEADQAALRRFGKLACLEALSFVCVNVHGELGVMHHLKALRDLEISNWGSGVADPTGDPVACRGALGRLTMLTRLEMEICRIPGFTPVDLTHPSGSSFGYRTQGSFGIDVRLTEKDLAMGTIELVSVFTNAYGRAEEGATWHVSGYTSLKASSPRKAKMGE